MTTTAPARRPRALVALLAALLLVVLSGCVKFDADFQVSAEETLSGSLRILVDPVALEDMGSPDPSGELDDAIEEAQSDPEMPAGMTVERLEDEDGYIGMGLTFADVPATEFQSSGGVDTVGVEGIEVSSADGEITFTMTNPLVAGMDTGSAYGGGSGMPTTARSMFDSAIVAVSFPGNVVSADGAEVAGKTATWDLREYDGESLTAVGEASSFPWGILLLVGGIVLFLVIVAGVVILILVLRKKKSAPSGAPSYPDGALSHPGMAPVPGHPGGGHNHPGQPGAPGMAPTGPVPPQGYPQAGPSGPHGYGPAPGGRPAPGAGGYPQPGTPGPAPMHPGAPAQGAPWQGPPPGSPQGHGPAAPQQPHDRNRFAPPPRTEGPDAPRS